MNDLAAHLKPATILKPDNMVLKATDEDIFETTHSITPSHCTTVLKEIENGKSISELVFKYQIKEETIEKRHKNAQKLIKNETKREYSRLFSDYTKSKQNKEKVKQRLCPQKPSSKTELTDADEIISNIRTLYSSNKELILWCTDYYVSYINRSSSALSFTQFTDFKNFITLLTQVVAKTRITLYFEPCENSKITVNHWQKVSLGIPIYVKNNKLKNKNLFPQGRLKLFFEHPDKKNIIVNKTSKLNNAEKYSTASLRYVFHILAIML